MPNSPIDRLRLVGKIEAVSFLALLLIAMPLKYFADQPMPVKFLGWVHGVLFVWFCWALYCAWRATLPLSTSVLAFLAALVPFGPFLMDGRLKLSEKSADDSRAVSPEI